MLKLRYDTPPEWCERVREDVASLLIDHAHLEKKAAGTAVTLLFRYPECAALQEPLAALAQEELEHFRAVLSELKRRRLALRRQRASPYAGRLHAEVRSREPGRLVDTLLVAALIEARSCERFTLLANGLGPHERELAALYRALLASEARHHGVYLRLAEAIAGDKDVRARFETLAEREAEIARDLVQGSAHPGAAVRLHS